MNAASRESRRQEAGSLRRDFLRYCAPDASLPRKLWVLFDTPGLQCVTIYRFGRWIHRAVRWRPARIPLSMLHYVLDRLCIICWGMSINARAEIGPGLFIGHFGGVIIGPIRMGEDCNISHQVTIGVRVDGPAGVPVFGDNVWIGPGCVIFGDITVGSGVTIGPYTVVSRSLPDHVMVAGNPLRVVAKDYDNHQAIYGRPREVVA